MDKNKVALKEMVYQVNDYQSGKSFLYRTKIQEASVVANTMSALLKHDELSVKIK